MLAEFVRTQANHHLNLPPMIESHENISQNTLLYAGIDDVGLFKHDYAILDTKGCGQWRSQECELGGGLPSLAPFLPFPFPLPSPF